MELAQRYCAHHVAQYYRREQRQTRIVQAVETLGPQHAKVVGWLERRDAEPHDVLVTAEMAVLIRATLASLSDDYEDLLTQKYLEGVSVEQMADQRAATATAVRSRLARARRPFGTRSPHESPRGAPPLVQLRDVMSSDDQDWDEDERFETLFAAANHDALPPDAAFLERLRTRSTQEFLDQCASSNKPQPAARRSNMLFLTYRFWAAAAAVVLAVASWSWMQNSGDDARDDEKSLRIVLTHLTDAQSLHLKLVQCGTPSEVWVAKPNQIALGTCGRHVPDRRWPAAVGCQ